MSPLEPSPLVRVGIPALAIFVAALFVFGNYFAARRARAVPGGDAAAAGAPARAAVGLAALFGVSGVLAYSGVLAHVTRPVPPMMPLLAFATAATVVFGCSAAGARVATRLPLFSLVGFQAFRIPLELVLRRAAEDGVLPVQMTFAGDNFDVVSGVTALALGVALYFADVPRAVVAVWNALGFALLSVIVAIALASMPWIRAFGPDHVNVLVLQFPYVWLPIVLVQAALLGHVLVLRRLLSDRASARGEMRRAFSP
jgi:hypothetical protein